MHWTNILGFLLLGWVVYDLLTGKVWLHRPFNRSEEPLVYWLAITLWTLVGISSFYWNSSF
jgi:hypothetical protein